MTETATLTSKGQLTVPKAVREAMGLKPGDRLTFREEADGRWTIERRTRDFRDLIGILAKYAGPTPVGREEIDAAIEEAMIEQDERSRGLR